MRPVATSPADKASAVSASLHATLTSLITRSLGADHAALFTVPVVGVDGRLDWCTGLMGDIVAPSAMSPPVRIALRQQADKLLADLRRLQVRLHSEGPASRAAARLLMQAIDLDLDTCLHAVGGQPVLAPWGAVMPAIATPAAAVYAKPVVTVTAAEPAMASQVATKPVPVALTPNLTAGRRRSLHVASSLLLLLAGGGALAAALHSRPPADSAAAASIEALTRRNADLSLAIDRARSGNCKRLP